MQLLQYTLSGVAYLPTWHTQVLLMETKPFWHLVHIPEAI